MPLWMVVTFSKMLGPLTAGRQLLAIEVACVPRMKPDSAQSVIDRHRRRFSRERRLSTVEQLMKAFPAREVPTTKSTKEPD